MVLAHNLHCGFLTFVGHCGTCNKGSLPAAIVGESVSKFMKGHQILDVFTNYDVF